MFKLQGMNIRICQQKKYPVCLLPVCLRLTSIGIVVASKLSVLGSIGSYWNKRDVCIKVTRNVLGIRQLEQLLYLYIDIFDNSVVGWCNTFLY